MAPRRGSGSAPPGQQKPPPVPSDGGAPGEQQVDTPPQADQRPFIVAWGASAGGLEAFSQVLDSLRPDLRAAFVFVQHLAPEHESMLSALLQHHTKMPVADARDGARIESGRVYVAPPGMLLTLRDGALHLNPRSAD